jgi:hypothetical protein
MKKLFVFASALVGLILAGSALADDHGVARAQFTTAISDREPTDAVTELSTDRDRVIFFTEYRDMEGSTLTHRWMHDGEEMATVSSDIGGPRWRTWSSKRLMDSWTGTWTVEIVNEEGEVVDSRSFEYMASEESMEESDEMEESEDMEEEMDEEEEQMMEEGEER